MWVLHTCASEYYPPDSELAVAVEFLRARQFPQAFHKLDELITGERGPYRSVPVGPQHRDPSQPSLMAAFVSLKHDRVVKLLDEAPVEMVAAISPVHSAGRDTSRSVAARYLAEYLIQRYGGIVHEVGSLDHEGAYRVLIDLHRRYSLDGGYNFELTLTGTKMHVVGAAMLASTAAPASAYYSAPDRFDPERFTRGTGITRVVHCDVYRRRQVLEARCPRTPSSGANILAADNLPPSRTSHWMSRVRSRGTNLERLIRSELHKRDLWFRKDGNGAAAPLFSALP